ncbi:Leucyl aminopeptidase yscIV [Nowakowskiella sp. JEL0078]|nr:Leucyl aminopeptidase yscIV [Nowakowskiella sp. JEL0078]
MSGNENTPLIGSGSLNRRSRIRADPQINSEKFWQTKIFRQALITAILVIGIFSLLAFFPHRVSLARETHVSNVFKHMENINDLTKHYPRRSRSVVNGYNASAEYIRLQLATHTDFEIEIQHFPIQLYVDITEPKFTVSVTNSIGEIYEKSFVFGTEFASLFDSGSATLDIVSLSLVRGGCDVKDFNWIEPESVVLINREGQCSYRVKIKNAIEAQVSGIILFSPATLGEPILGRCVGCFKTSTIGLGVSQIVGLELLELLASSNDVKVTLSADTGYKEVITSNVLATTSEGQDNKIIVVGSHLDSVPQGPGMNDDASGASTTLEIALTLYRSGLSKRVVNKVRFAFWAAEELGLLGSLAYVRELAKSKPDELKKIILNLNDDMLASPNFARLVYNGRAAEPPIDQRLNGPSGVIQDVFEGWLDYKGLTHEITPFNGRSDYGGFLEYGIPAGGLFTGAEEIKTPAQVAKFGGIAGVAFDPCYHQACDDLSNVSGPGKTVLAEMASALAYTVQRFAFEKEIKELLAGERPIGNPALWD